MLARMESRLGVKHWHGMPADAARLFALADEPLEPSIFLRPEVTLPILKRQGSARLTVVEEAQQCLLAVGTVPNRGFDSSLNSNFTSASLPLVSADLNVEAVACWLKSLRRPIMFRSLQLNSAFYDLLQKSDAKIAKIVAWERAALNIQGKFEDWMVSNFSQKRRKEMKRLQARLSEQGELKFRALKSKPELETFVANHVALEAGGWKGKAGTAIQKGNVSHFEDICLGLMASGKLRFWTLELNGKVIASLMGAVDGTSAAIIKIAYDETLARFSPGVLLILETTKCLFEEPGLKLADSCAIPNHPMIDRIWRDRLPFGDVLVGGPEVSQTQFKIVLAALSIRHKLRAGLKSIYYAVTRKKKS